MGSNQDYADSASVISFYGAGGLGLPERDYYTRTDARAWSSASSMWNTCAIYCALGRAQTQAVADAKTVLALETRLAKASLTITEQRDPKNLNHPSDVAAFSKQLTHFSLAEYVTAAHAPASGKLNDTEPKFFSEFNTLVAIRRSITSRPICAGTCCMPTPAPACRKPSTTKLAFLFAHFERRGKRAGALEALHQPRDYDLAKRWDRRL